MALALGCFRGAWPGSAQFGVPGTPPRQAQVSALELRARPRPEAPAELQRELERLRLGRGSLEEQVRRHGPGGHGDTAQRYGDSPGGQEDSPRWGHGDTARGHEESPRGHGDNLEEHGAEPWGGHGDSPGGHEDTARPHNLSSFLQIALLKEQELQRHPSGT